MSTLTPTQAPGAKPTHFKAHDHNGPVKVLTIANGVEVWAGSANEILSFHDTSFEQWDLMLPLSAMHTPNQAVSINRAAASLFSDLVQEMPVVSIDWPDYGAPQLSRKWWDLLIAKLAMLPSKSRVVVFCQGGHGRTGTFLAILGTLCGVIPQDTDPVTAIRAAYCKDAVESDRQFDYLEAITGVQSLEEPSWGGWQQGMVPNSGVKSAGWGQEATLVGSGGELPRDRFAVDDGLFPVDDIVDPNEDLGTDADGNLYFWGEDGHMHVTYAADRTDKKHSIWTKGQDGNWIEEAIGTDFTEVGADDLSQGG
jgi:hypothetical protein